MEIFKFYKKYRWSILSGLCIGTSYIPFPPWALAFAYAPIFADLVLSPHPKTFWRGVREVFCKGWWVQFVLTLVGFHWIYYAAHQFGNLPLPLAILVALLYASVIHLYIPLALVMVHILGESRRFHLSWERRLFLFPLFIVSGEMVWPSLFPWNLGYPLLSIDTQVGWAQTADIWGFQGLSLIVHLLSSLVVWLGLSLRHPLFLWSRGRKGWGPVLLAIIFTGGFLMLTHLLGESKRSYWSKPEDHLGLSPGNPSAPGIFENLKVLMVQAVTPDYLKKEIQTHRFNAHEVLDQYLQITSQGLRDHPDTELVLWPETALPDYLISPVTYTPITQEVKNFIQYHHKFLLTGGPSQTTSPRPSRSLNLGVRSMNRFDLREHNSLGLFNPDGSIEKSIYHKSHLLAFGEYTPLDSYFPILKKISPAGEGWAPGDGPMAIPFFKGLIGPQICYESLFPHLTHQEILHFGAEILVNVTNDSWYGPQSEPLQHLLMTSGRAIEGRRPLLRSTNSGISAAIEADGKIISPTPLSTQGAFFFELSYRRHPPLTFYTQHGFWAVPTFLVGMMLLVLFVNRRRSDQDGLE